MRMCKVAMFAVLLVTFGSLGSNAQEEELNPLLAAIINEAATHEEGKHFGSTLKIVLAANPDQAALIDAYVAANWPEQRGGALADAGDPAAQSEAETETIVADAAAPEVAPEEKAADAHKSLPGWLSLGAWNAQLELGFSASSGDSDERAIFLGLDLKRTFADIWEHTLDLDADVARRQGVTSKERVVGDYQLYLRKWDRAYGFFFLRGDYDKLSGFDYRVTESFGAGYEVIRGKRANWKIEAGPGLRQTKLDGGGPLQNEFTAFFSSLYAIKLGDEVEASNDTKLFLGSGRRTVENTAALTAQINSSLAARLSYFIKNDSSVPVGSATTNSQAKATLLFKF